MLLGGNGRGHAFVCWKRMLKISVIVLVVVIVVLRVGGHGGGTCRIVPRGQRRSSRTIPTEARWLRFGLGLLRRGGRVWVDMSRGSSCPGWKKVVEAVCYFVHDCHS